jgi:hypothetical protein
MAENSSIYDGCPQTSVQEIRGGRHRGVLLACIVIVLLGGALPATASARIYFFSSPSAPLDASHNRLVVRPSGFPLFLDGQWVLEKLRWTDWGSPVARARGLSSSSDGQPNATDGKRIITRARVRLSKPGRYHDDDVYRCIRITVPPPAHYGSRCLQRLGTVVGLFTPGSGEPVGAAEAEPGVRHLSEFFSPHREVWCKFSDAFAELFCGTEPEPPTRSASIDERGHVSLCEVLQNEYPPGSPVPLRCLSNWPSNPLPVLHYGQENAIGPFRCTSATNGITCLKASNAGAGNGFRVSKDEAVVASP